MNDEQFIMEKILSAGTPLSEWGVKLHYGFEADYGKTFVIDEASKHAKYLYAVLNSTMAHWFACQSSLPTGAKSPRIEEMPIPKISVVKQRPFIALVDEIVAAKADNPGADTWYKEIELNDLVYDLYEITDEEEDAIERRLGLIPATEEEEDAILAKLIEKELASGGERTSIEEVRAILQEQDADRN